MSEVTCESSFRFCVLVAQFVSMLQLFTSSQQEKYENNKKNLFLSYWMSE